MVIYPQRFHPTFGQHFDDGWAEINPRYLIVSTEPRAAGRVLARASSRLLLVTHAGAELSGVDDDDGEDYTPNYVSSPRLAPDGASVWLDCKGEVSQAMADTMLKIVVEEMSRAGIVGVLAVPTDELTRPAGPSGELPSPLLGILAGPGPYDWAVARVVDSDEPGLQWEYLTPDGAWTLDAEVADRRPITTDDPWDALSDADLAASWAAQDAEAHGGFGPSWTLVARAAL